jgi:hypothetical protein
LAFFGLILFGGGLPAFEGLVIAVYAQRHTIDPQLGMRSAFDALGHDRLTINMTNINTILVTKT